MNYIKNIPKIIGLTGAIASGKNTVAQIFSNMMFAVFDADLIVNDLYKKNINLIDKIAKLYPQVISNNTIDKNLLGQLITNSPNILKSIENYVHPLVFEKYQEFIAENQQKNAKIVVLNIPLLLESSNYKANFIVAIIADKDTRLKRYLIRENNNSNQNNQDKLDYLINKFNLLNQKQLSDEERIKNAHYIIYNQGDYNNLAAQVQSIYQQINQIL